MRVNGTVAKIEMYAVLTSGLGVVENPVKDLPQVTAYKVFQDEYNQTSYTALIENPASGKLMQYLSYRVAFLDDSNNVLGISSGQITLIFPGEKQAINGSWSMSYLPKETKITKVLVQVVPPSNDYDVMGIGSSGLTQNPLTSSQVSFVPGDYNVKVTGILQNSWSKSVSVKVEVVFYDESGNIIGGAEGYPPTIPANGKVAFEVQLYQKIQPAKIAVYPMISGVNQ
jgi:hypothetical protein